MYDGTTDAPKHHARGRAFVALLTIGLLTIATGAAASSTTGETSGSGQSSGRDGDKVKICHRTAAETNPYRIPPVDSAGAANAHMDHTGPIFGQQAPGQKWGDIIEPFTFRGQDFPGLNWTAEGQEIWQNGCAVPPVDVCENIDGDQAEPPDGTVVDENGDCVPPPVDVCENIDGDQAEPPDGTVVDENGDCVPPPVDVCENIDGDQAEPPDGTVVDENGDCVPPPVDVCENIDGDQAEPPDGTVVDENGDCVAPRWTCARTSTVIRLSPPTARWSTRTATASQRVPEAPLRQDRVRDPVPGQVAPWLREPRPPRAAPTPARWPARAALSRDPRFPRPWMRDLRPRRPDRARCSWRRFWSGSVWC